MKLSLLSIWFAFLNLLWNSVPTITTCTDGMLNCQTCLDTLNCAVCYPGNGLIQPGTGLQCSICQVSSCANCSTSVTACLACNDPQGVRNVGGIYSCVPCSPANCVKCSSNASICQQCDLSIAFLGLQNGLCANCIDPNCAVCRNNTSICEQCTSGYGVAINGGCIACRVASSLCTLCTTSTNCISCQPGYGPSMGHCVTCSQPHCNLCSISSLSCEGCASPYGLNSLDVCVTCSRAHCIICPLDYLTCSGCESGFGLTAFGSCATCTDTHCAQCGSDNTACTLCNPGFGMSGGACNSCFFPCLDCLSADCTKCTTCVAGYYLSLNTCFPCMANCLECTSIAACTTCNTTYYLDPTNSSCVLCPYRCSTCIYNPNFYQPKCNSCTRGSEFDPLHVPRICWEICGDGYTTEHSCDNALNINYDGCDNYCQVMPDFVCNVSNVTGGTLCSYTGVLQMQITRFYKNPVANDFSMTVKIFPPLYILSQNSQTEISNIFAIVNTSSLAVSSVSYNSLTSELMFQGEVTGALSSDDQITIAFQPGLGNSPEYFASINSSVVLAFGQNIYFYSTLSLNLAKIVLYVCYALPVLGWISFFLGVILRKLPGLEAMFVLQFGLCIMVELNTDLIWPFEQTHPLRFATGFNYAFIQQNSTLSQNAPYFSQYHLSPLYFVNNYNLTPLILQALSFFYLLFTTIKVRNFIKESKNLKKDFIKQQEKSVDELETLIDRNERAHIFLMHSCMVSLVYFAFCGSLYFKINSTMNIPSLVLFAFGTAIFLFTFIRFYIDPCSFDYFRFSFYMSQLAMNHYFIYIAVLVSSVLLLVIVSEIVFTTAIPLALFFIYTLLYRPYKQIRENLRSAFNILAMCCLAGFRIYLSYLPKKQLASSTVMTFFLIIFVVILPTVIILSLVGTIYSYVEDLRLLKEEECLNNKKLLLIREKTRRILFELGIVSINTNMGYIKDQTTFRELIDNQYNIKTVSNKLRDEFVREEIMRSNIQKKMALTHNLIEASAAGSKHAKQKQQIKLDIMLKKPKKPTDDVVNNFARHRHSPQIIELTKIERKGSITKSSKLESKTKPVDEIEIQSEYQIAKTVLAEENKFVNLRGAVEYVREQQQLPVDENADLYLQEFDKIKL